MTRITARLRISLLLIACLLAWPGRATAVDIVELAYSFPDGGGYDDTWRGTGVLDEIRFQGEQILAQGDGSYCCGYTFAVAMKVASARGLLHGKTPDQIRVFQKRWYGATEESRETQCVMAAEKLGIGRGVPPEDARPGDFLQFWRTNGSGHSVVFLQWIEERGKRIGFKYRSSQGSTNGVGDRAEFFVGIPATRGLVIPQRIYFCRLDNGDE